MLGKRVLTAAIALPIALLILLKGGHDVLLMMFCLFVAIGTYEISAMLFHRMEAVFSGVEAIQPSSGTWRERWPTFIAIFFAVSIFLLSAEDSKLGGRGVILVGLLGSILLGCFLSPDIKIAMARISCLLISVVYGSFPWLATWELYIMNEDSRFLIFLMAVVWCGDTGAYFVGRFYGRTKLAPQKSPNKTWEGAIGGLLASLLGGAVVNIIYGFQLGNWWAVVSACLFGGALGQMGDLVESTFKRFAMVKDSGSIFPGHGGFLDRLDGVLFAAPVIWFSFYIF